MPAVIASPRRRLAALLVGVLLSACATPPAAAPDGSAPTDPAPPRSAVAATTSPDVQIGVSTQERIAMVLSRLPACDGAPAGTVGDPEVEGLVLPPDASVVGVTADGALTTVEARVPLDPVQVRQFYELQNIGVLKTLMVEDEILEAEALVESRTHRMYVKAQAECRDRSILYVVVAPGGTDRDLPQPGEPGAPGGPPPTTPPS